MSFWAALGKTFTLLFEPPVISFESLRNDGWKKHYTVKNVCFGLFWGMAFSIGTSYGVWSRLWEYLLVDAHTFCEYTPWTGVQVWLILALVILVAGFCLAVVYPYARRPHHFEHLRKIVECTMFYLRSAYKVKNIARIVDVLPVFVKQLSMNYFLFRTRDDDGEIMIIEGPEEKPESKNPKTRFGVPKSIRDQKKQAIESAQVVVDKSNGNGSIGKAAGPMKKK
ncbi:hypothetical protein DL98DRAFT_585894 [Cadophora sp. DSE1049]|nr:hypothetical protein DL98DRAFT_585894 [Cadophora sp. DSE1049]